MEKNLQSESEFSLKRCVKTEIRSTNKVSWNPNGHFYTTFSFKKVPIKESKNVTTDLRIPFKKMPKSHIFFVPLK